MMSVAQLITPYGGLVGIRVRGGARTTPSTTDLSYHRWHSGCGDAVVGPRPTRMSMGWPGDDGDGGHFQLTEPGQLVERVERFLADEDRRRAQTAAHGELLRRIGDFIAIALVASGRAHNINDPIWPWIKPVYVGCTCLSVYLCINARS